MQLLEFDESKTTSSEEADAVKSSKKEEWYWHLWLEENFRFIYKKHLGFMNLMNEQTVVLDFDLALIWVAPQAILRLRNAHPMRFTLQFCLLRLGVLFGSFNHKLV